MVLGKVGQQLGGCGGMEEDLTIVCPRDNVIVFKTSGHCADGGCVTLQMCVTACACPYVCVHECCVCVCEYITTNVKTKLPEHKEHIETNTHL